MTSLWHRLLARALTRVYFNRVTVLNPERLPRAGPAFYVALHRNGAVDGFVYSSILPRASFLISTQLRKSLIARLFFSGIEVARGKDEGDRSANAEALARCRELLQAGGQLAIFPEGTSGLGPRHLPFKSGAARILLDCLDRGVVPPVIPLGISYESPWSFRSNVEIVVGAPISTDLSGVTGPRERLRLLKGRVEAALEEVGVNVDTPAYQERIQALAYASTLATPRSYHRSLKALESAIPEPVRQEWDALEPELRGRSMLRHQGVTLYPMKHRWLYALLLLVFAPITLAAGVANLPPLLGAWIAGRVFPDAPNVVSLWRILVGAPLAALWVAGIAAASLWLGQPLLAAGYAALTLAGLWLYYRVRKLAVAVGNAVFHPALRTRMLGFRDILLKALPHE